jgi:hypothetical protein
MALPISSAYRPPTGGFNPANVPPMGGIKQPLPQPGINGGGNAGLNMGPIPTPSYNIPRNAVPSTGVTGGSGVSTSPPAASNPYKLQNTATEQQAGDYSTIMQGYKDMLAKGGSATPYTASGARAPAIANLAELSRTGGYSPEDLQNLRARAISPIRSVYSSAQQGLNRNKALQGGYSPNYAAASAKMAREQSEQLGGAMTNVNADIAGRVAEGRMNAASPYASITGQQAGAEDEASQFNRREIPQQQAQALQGMTSLYGTTPALSELFGRQALQGSQLQNQINQQGNQQGMQLIDQMMRRMG